MLLLTGACNPLDEGPAVSISAYADVALPPGHVFEVTIAGVRHEVQMGSDRHTRYEINREAPRTGQLDVTARLRGPAGVSRAEGTFRQRFQDGSNHWVAGHVGTHRPVGHCIGSLLAIGIDPAPAAGADTLFILYGGIPNDAVC